MSNCFVIFLFLFLSCSIVLGHIEETCNNTVDGSSGICINIYQCQQYLLLVQLYIQNKDQNTANKLKHTKCDYNGHTIKVCCPNSPHENKVNSTVDPSNHHLRELPKPGICGVSVARSFRKIVNGNPAKPGDFPWMVLLLYRNYPELRCGGSLISGHHVLTAAHCIPTLKDVLDKVRLGELDLEKDDDGATPIDVPIILHIIHEEYKSHTNDIGILVLGLRVNFTDLIKPICLPQSEELRQNTFVEYNPFVTGWGNTETRANPSSHLLMAQVPVKKNDDCKKVYGSISKDLVIDQRVLCAGNGITDACKGDSGGPLMMPILNDFKFYFYQIGIVSYGKKCADPKVPGVYTRVTHFMPWITEKVFGKST